MSLPTVMHLLVGIDTEGDNQWDAAARANQRSRTSTRCRGCTRCSRGTASGRPTSSPIRSRPIARSAEVLRALLARRRLRDRRAPSRVGNAAVHRRRRRAASVRVDAAARAVRGAARGADRRDRRGGRRAAGVVPLRPVRVLGRPRRRRSSGTATSSNRASRRSSTRRTRAGRSSSRRRSRRTSSPTTARRRPGTSDLLEVPVSAALNRRLPEAAAVSPTRARRGRTRPSACCGRCGSLRMRWLRPSYSSLDDMIGLARDLARAGEPVLNLLFHSSEAIVGGSPYNRTQARARRVLRSARAVPRVRHRASSAPCRRRSPSSAHALLRRDSSASMRILHVTPHLPPDQAANALLPWQLGNWAREARRRRSSTSRIRREPAARADCAGPGDLDAAPHAAACSIATLRARRACSRRCGSGARSAPAIARADVVHVHSNGLLAELARAAGATARQAGRPDAVRHRDLALRAEAVRPGPLHARLPRGVGRHVLQRAAAGAGAASSA